MSKLNGCLISVKLLQNEMLILPLPTGVIRKFQPEVVVDLWIGFCLRMHVSLYLTI